MKKEPIIFYIIIALISVVIVFVFDRSYFFKFTPKINFLSILATIIYLVLLFLSEKFLYDKKNDDDLINDINQTFGGKRTFFTNMVIAIIGSFSEEILFRFFLLWFFNVVLKINIYISIFLLSLFFGVLHLTQKLYGIIVSFVTSIFFYSLVLITNSIFLPMILHFSINFFQLETLRRKNEKLQNS